ncbi:MAG: DNA mismatch repair protein MutS [Lachnospiraceae bacterium]|nr:DNA mismatch repair protein MutS [Lachnospiraceae bacterium]
MMQHYLQTKEKYKDAILFYRLGDFYEMFFEDAKIVSRELELTLTGKSCGLKERAPMCGVPFHAADNYMNRLVSKGYKVAICEQLEDPKSAKGIVKRDVIRIVTPGTNISATANAGDENCFIVCAMQDENLIGTAIADVTTGEFYVSELKDNREFMDCIARYAPKELICNRGFAISGIDLDSLKSRFNLSPGILESHYFDPHECASTLMEHFKVKSLNGLGLHDLATGSIAAGALFKYIQDTQMTDLKNITGITPLHSEKYILLDSFALRNLEITETLREKQKRGSLLWVLDHTKTAMGARKLKSMLEQPLMDPREIEMRLSAVEELCGDIRLRDTLRESLNGVYDLERLMCRISFASANPRELIALKESVRVIPKIKEALEGSGDALLSSLNSDIDPLSDIFELIDKAIVEEPPLVQKAGGIIKPGYSKEADELRDAGTNGKRWLSELEEREKERTGIKNLKIKFSKVFGYAFEVSNSFLGMVPNDYIRKQTLTGGERFITEELNKLADTILNSEEKLNQLEYVLFDEIRTSIASNVLRVQKTAAALAMLDFLQSLSYTAEQNNYVRPSINENGVLKIKGGRHPVVEKMMGDESFVKNDLILDGQDRMLSLITGPNMAGKSTYMRQTALITLMACVGSFVPADEADICIVDRIFTRVGASDDLSSGQSTFMVEMTEVANILRNATSKSLLILDEIGRGTSTFDGLSIAWAVIEYLCRHNRGAKTLFATHYHELTELEGKIDGVHNYCFAVREHGDDVIFLRKVIEGSADRSYGIHVARIAGVPEEVVNRANELLSELINNDIIDGIKEIADRAAGKSQADIKGSQEEEYYQYSIFDTMKQSGVEREILNMDLSRTTPIEALNKLDELQKRLKSNEQYSSFG